MIAAVFCLFLGIALAGSACPGTSQYACSSKGATCKHDMCCTATDPDTGDCTAESECNHRCVGTCSASDYTADFQSTCKEDFDYASADINTIEFEEVGATEWSELSSNNRIAEVPPDQIDPTDIDNIDPAQLTSEQLQASGGENIAAVDNLADLDPAAAEDAIGSLYPAAENIDLSAISASGATITADGVIDNGGIAIDIANDVGGTPEIIALSEGGFRFEGSGTYTPETIADDVSYTFDVSAGGGLTVAPGADGHREYYADEGTIIIYTREEWTSEVTVGNDDTRIYYQGYDNRANHDNGATPGIYLDEGSVGFVGVDGTATITNNNNGETTYVEANLGLGEFLDVDAAHSVVDYNIPNGYGYIENGGQSVTFKEGKFYGCNASSGACPTGSFNFNWDFYDGTGHRTFSMTQEGITTTNLGKDDFVCEGPGCPNAAGSAAGSMAGSAAGSAAAGAAGSAAGGSLTTGCHSGWDCPDGTECYSTGQCVPCVEPTFTWDPTTRTCQKVGCQVNGCPAGQECTAEGICRTCPDGSIYQESTKTCSVVCADGTLFGQCSTINSGKYCSNGQLVPACTSGTGRPVCPCANGASCVLSGVSAGQCILSCSDGTLAGFCSTTSASTYCTATGSLTSDCGICGCPTGQICQAATNTCISTSTP